MGMEATGFSTGDQLEDFNSIPVEHAVAVECDEQVLGEFEEFSRRIYALNENMSSFRRPRKSSDKSLLHETWEESGHDTGSLVRSAVM